MIQRTRAVALVAVLTLLAAGCNDDEPAAEPSSTLTTSESSPTEATASTETAPATSSSTAPPPTTGVTTTSEAVPPTSPSITTGPTSPPPAAEDWVAVVQALENTRTALYEAPDPARVTEVCASGSPCEEQYQAQLADLVSDGQRVVDSPPQEVVSAEVVPNSYEGVSIAESIVVSIDVVFRIPAGAAGRIVDAAGATVFNIAYTPPPGQTYGSRITLFRSTPTEPWRQSFYEDIP